MYVTPDAFKQMRLGSDVTGIPDLQLAVVLERASTIVNGYCTVPTIPQPHDFRGGSIVGEQHVWRLPEGGPGSDQTGTRRVYPFHWPIKAVSEFNIAVTNTQIALDIQPSEIIIQNSDRYLEVVTLIGATFGLFNAIAMPNAFLATPTVRLDYTYGREIRQTGETIYPVDETNRVLFRAINQWWLVDVDHTVNVYVGGVLTTSGFTVDADEGTILFDAPVTGSVKVDYTYTLMPEVRDATALIARYEFAQSAITAKGLSGLETIRMAELEITQRREPRGSGVVSANNLDRLVPEAADLLSGMKFYRMAA
jgi:hypothetical protein